VLNENSQPLEGASIRTPVVVTAGQTTQIVLGGIDASLHGQVRFETRLTSDYRLAAELSTIAPKLPDGLTAEERKTYMSSAEWKEQNNNRRNYAAVVNEDGSVAFDAIAPGQYTLKVTAQKPDADSFRSQPIAQGEIVVTVPVGANPAAPIQIGEVVLKAHNIGCARTLLVHRAHAPGSPQAMRLR
jgi:hypothetical protein